MSDLRHIAIIMDGNGRWARERGLPRIAGHKAGMETLHNIVRYVGQKKIEWLTLFAFSSENWSRPVDEVNHLMDLLKLFIKRDLMELHRNNTRIRIIGGTNHISPDICKLLRNTEDLTKNNTGLNLVVAFNYGGRDEITRATKKLAMDVERGILKSSDITQSLIENYLDTTGIPSPDVVIRTSGEQRLSNFLLWQSAYSELSFVDCYWPDFTPADIDRVMADFCKRERRFGNVNLIDKNRDITK